MATSFLYVESADKLAVGFPYISKGRFQQIFQQLAICEPSLTGTYFFSDLHIDIALKGLKYSKYE